MLEEQTHVAIGRSKTEIDTPALLLDAEAFEANLARGQRDFNQKDVRYRPHAKAHKSRVIARKQVQHGAVGICCAKLAEAEVLASAGIEDILITTPVVGQSKMRRLIELEELALVSVVVDDQDNVKNIARAAESAGIEIDLLVEVDVGQNRCGVRSPKDAVRLAYLINESAGVRFRGLQGYQGSSQLIPGFRERAAQTKTSADRLRAVLDELGEAGIDPEILTGGGTGTSAIDIDIGWLTELQPGSYIFMDSTYANVEWSPDGTPPPFRQSLSVVATVISRPSRSRAVVDAGLKALSSDSGAPAVKDNDRARFSFAGDEHGIIEFRKGDAPSIGSRIELFPSHCDTTVNLFDEFMLIRDRTVEDVWPIEARGKTQ